MVNLSILIKIREFIKDNYKILIEIILGVIVIAVSVSSQFVVSDARDEVNRQIGRLDLLLRLAAETESKVISQSSAIATIGMMANQLNKTILNMELKVILVEGSVVELNSTIIKQYAYVSEQTSDLIESMGGLIEGKFKSLNESTDNELAMIQSQVSRAQKSIWVELVNLSSNITYYKDVIEPIVTPKVTELNYLLNNVIYRNLQCSLGVSNFESPFSSSDFLVSDSICTYSCGQLCTIVEGSTTFKHQGIEYIDGTLSLRFQSSRGYYQIGCYPRQSLTRLQVKTINPITESC